jgi:hypothetical protein
MQEFPTGTFCQQTYFEAFMIPEAGLQRLERGEHG